MPRRFYGLCHGPGCFRYLTWRRHCNITDTNAYIARCLEASFSRTYALTGRQNGCFLGVFELRRANPHSVGFGYSLARPWWGRGLMTEGLSAMVDWALWQPCVWRIGDVCDVENAASARVMETAGLQREGVLRRWAVHPNLGPEPRDCISYARVK